MDHAPELIGGELPQALGDSALEVLGAVPHHVAPAPGVLAGVLPPGVDRVASVDVARRRERSGDGAHQLVARVLGDRPGDREWDLRYRAELETEGGGVVGRSAAGLPVLADLESLVRVGEGDTESDLDGAGVLGLGP